MTRPCVVLAMSPATYRAGAFAAAGEAIGLEIVRAIDLPDDFATRLMELGFLPGSSVTAARCAPGGDPRVFQVDGSEIALRKETAARLLLKM